MYSQNDEERIILEHTPAAGRFLDIGAFDAKALSNTRALFERGWSGVCVEPSPGPLARLLEDYAFEDRVHVIGAAVGPERSLTQMWLTNDAVSTSNQDVYNTWKYTVNYYARLWVPTITLDNLINQFGPFHFVNIDAEGSSVDILRTLLKSPMLPACICVEHDSRGGEIMQIMTGSPYRIVGSNGENLILAR